MFSLLAPAPLPSCENTTASPSLALPAPDGAAGYELNDATISNLNFARNLMERIRLDAISMLSLACSPGDAVLCETRVGAVRAAEGAPVRCVCSAWPQRQRATPGASSTFAPRVTVARSFETGDPGVTLSVEQSPHVARVWRARAVPASTVEVRLALLRVGARADLATVAAISAALVGLHVCAGAEVSCHHIAQLRGQAVRVHSTMPRTTHVVRVEASTTIVVLPGSPSPPVGPPPALSLTPGSVAAHFSVDAADGGSGAGSAIALSRELRSAATVLRETILLPAMHYIARISQCSSSSSISADNDAGDGGASLSALLGALLASSSGVLLHGPSGCGKSALLHHVVAECNRTAARVATHFSTLHGRVLRPGRVRVFPVSMAAAAERGSGHAEEYLRNVFAAANAHARGDGAGSSGGSAGGGRADGCSLPSVAIVAIEGECVSFMYY